MKYTVEGKPDGDTLVFVHGWPDDARVWRKQVEWLRNDYRCVLVTLPNFGAGPHEPRGYDFPALIAMLDQVVEETRRAENERVVLVTHDWGAYIGYLYEQSAPQRVRAMVAMDIGGHFRAASVRAVLMILGYQWALFFAWLAGRFAPRLGNWMTRGVARVVGVPAHRLARVRARFNYPYYYFWRAMLLPWARKNLLTGYLPQCPVLFFYGSRKPVLFHSGHWLEIVDRSGGKTIRVDGAGHWFMETHPNLVNEAMGNWLGRLD